MKQAFLIIIFLSLFVAGCKKDAKPVAVAPQAPALDSSDVRTSATGEKITDVQLRYLPNLGTEYIYELTTSGRDSAIMKADTNITNVVESKMIYKMKVVPVETKKDSSTVYSVTFLNFVVDASSDNEKVSYRSGMSLDEKQKSMFLQYEAALNNTYTALISSTGELVKVSNTEKILAKVLELAKAPKNLKPEQKESIKRQIDVTLIYPTVQQLFRKLSKAKVSDNSNWTLDMDLPVNRILTFKTKQILTLKGLEKFGETKVARIDVTSQSTPDIAPEAKQNAINVEHASLDGTGKVLFDMNEKMLSYSKTSLMVLTAIKGETQGPKGKMTVQSRNRSEKVNTLKLLEARTKSSSK